MFTIHLFVLVGGPANSQKTSSEVVCWLRANIRIINDAGVRVYIEKVTQGDVESDAVQRKLRNSYGVNGFPALFVPSTPTSQKMTHNGWLNVQKALVPYILAGQKATKDKINDIAYPESDFDRLLRSDLNMQAQKTNNDEEDVIGKGFTSSDIQKQIARFNRDKKGFQIQDEYRSAIEEDPQGQRSDNITTAGTHAAAQRAASSFHSTQRSPANTRPPMSAVSSAGSMSDDALMDRFYTDRIGLE